MIWSWLSQEGKKGRPPMTNDNLRINTQVREGRRKRAESLFHHPSASVGLLINLWSLPLTLFWCLSLIFFHFTHSYTFVSISGNLSFCNKIEKRNKCYGVTSLHSSLHAITKVSVNFLLKSQNSNLVDCLITHL